MRMRKTTKQRNKQCNEQQKKRYSITADHGWDCLGGVISGRAATPPTASGRRRQS